MTRKEQNQKRAAWKRKGNVNVPEGKAGFLNIVYWNCNSIQSFNKLDQISRLINDQQNQQIDT